MGHFCSQINLLCILFVPICMIMFGIAFGRLPASILKILGSFQNAFWCHFEHVFADAAASRNAPVSREIFVLGDVGPPVLHSVCYVFASVFDVAF